MNNEVTRRISVEGTLQTGLFSAWSGVRLIVYERGISLRPRSLIFDMFTFGLIPRMDYIWRDIVRAERVPSGIRLFVDKQKRPIHFYCQGADVLRVLDGLKHHGVPVE